MVSNSKEYSLAYYHAHKNGDIIILDTPILAPLEKVLKDNIVY